MRDYELYIGGKWVKPAAVEYFESYNPFTQQVWARIPHAQKSNVEAAVGAARRATAWRREFGLGTLGACTASPSH